MSKDIIKSIIEQNTAEDGLTETGINGVQFFRATQSIPCVPAVYEPCVVAIVSGTKEVVLDGERYLYDNRKYLCCPTSLPVNAGTPSASKECPLYGVFISLDLRLMSQLSMEIESAGGVLPGAKGGRDSRGIMLAEWDDAFLNSLLRILQLSGDKTSAAVLADARLKELYFAILMGGAGRFTRQAFSSNNAIARSIAHISDQLDAPISIDDLALRAGMSRAVFHRKFKQATTMAPIQFVKSMRLNSAAMKIAGGVSVNEAAHGVGYVSPSQFSREFKRVYGQSPKQWGDSQQHMAGIS